MRKCSLLTSSPPQLGILADPNGSDVEVYLTAFATSDGATYQYRVMPFGLKNAPPTFQKLMACVLSGLLSKCATYEEHINAQRRYQECLAVVFAIKNYRPYLEDKPFLLRTDNKCLLWLNGAKDSNAKFTGWSLLLQEFNFRVEHCPGKNNELRDVLSRQPEDVEVPDDTEDVDRMLVPKREDEGTAATERVCVIDVPTLMDEGTR
jgi:hypothetical protein